MTLPSIILLLELAVILVVSIVAGGGVPLRNVPASEWAWVIVLAVVLLLEVLLIVFRDHTLSGQMQYYVRHHRLSGFFVIFFAWLAYHFVLEPVVRGIVNLWIKISN